MEITICVNGMCDSGLGALAFYAWAALLISALALSGIGCLFAWVYYRYVIWEARQPKP